MATVSNPFTGQEVGFRYARGRPYLHPLLLERLSPHLQGRQLGADVACGTGLSSLALAELLEQVLAFDVSPAMLEQAAPHLRIQYAQAPAEDLPVEDHVLDVVTVAQAFHWFDRQAFLAEVKRTLRDSGVLFLYDFFFVGEMVGYPQFADFISEYGTRYPPPLRHRDPFGVQQTAQAGFSFHEETFHFPWAFTHPQLVAYLMTHSNTLQANDSGRETPEQTRAWLTERLAPYFNEGEKQELMYRGWFVLLKPLEGSERHSAS